MKNQIFFVTLAKVWQNEFAVSSPVIINSAALPLAYTSNTLIPITRASDKLKIHCLACVFPCTPPYSLRLSLYKLYKLDFAISIEKSPCLPLLLNILNNHLLSKQRQKQKAVMRFLCNGKTVQFICNEYGTTACEAAY